MQFITICNRDNKGVTPNPKTPNDRKYGYSVSDLKLKVKKIPFIVKKPRKANYLWASKGQGLQLQKAVFCVGLTGGR